MKQHELKTDPEVFQESWDARKGYEIRFNDRDYQTGDRIVLKETRFSGEEMKAGKPLEFTGRTIVAIINGIITGYGLGEGWVILNYEGFTGYQADQESKHERWSLTWQLEKQAARITELEKKLKASIDRENGSDIAADMAMNSVNELQTRTIQQAVRIAELEGQIKSRVVCDGYPTFYISAEGRACTHRMSEDDTPVWCRSGNDGMAAMSAIQPPADALAMSESKADDYLRLAQKLRAGLQEIYTMRGEDEFIAGICNPLIEVSAP